jgi:hypothetical protein
MAVEWILLTKWTGGAKSAVALLDAASAKELAQLMESIGGVHLRTASRLLRDAVDRDGDARRLKCENAVGQLEVAYTAFTTQPAGVRWYVARMFSPKRYWRAERDAALVSVMLAGAYAALGRDPKSVEVSLNRGVQHLRARHVAIWTNECGGRTSPFDVRVSRALEHEHLAFMDTARLIASEMGIAGCPREPASWPHQRDPRLRVATT